MGYRYIPLNKQPEIPTLTYALGQIPGLSIYDEQDANDYTGGLYGRHPNLGRLLITFKRMDWEIDGFQGQGVLCLQFVRIGSEREEGAVDFLRTVSREVGSPIRDEIYFDPINFIQYTGQFKRY